MPNRNVLLAAKYKFLKIPSNFLNLPNVLGLIYHVYAQTKLKKKTNKNIKKLITFNYCEQNKSVNCFWLLYQTPNEFSAKKGWLKK